MDQYSVRLKLHVLFSGAWNYKEIKLAFGLWRVWMGVYMNLWYIFVDIRTIQYVYIYFTFNPLLPDDALRHHPVNSG